mgnify:CR=1 FL=1
MRELFRRRIVVPALRGAIAVLKSTCWKPGDPVTRFSTSWEELIGDPDADTEGYDETTQIDVRGGTITPLTPEEERRMLEYLEANKDKYGPEAFKKSEVPCD